MSLLFLLKINRVFWFFLNFLHHPHFCCSHNYILVVIESSAYGTYLLSNLPGKLLPHPLSKHFLWIYTSLSTIVTMLTNLNCYWTFVISHVIGLHPSSLPPCALMSLRNHHPLSNFICFAYHHHQLMHHHPSLRPPWTFCHYYTLPPCLLLSASTRSFSLFPTIWGQRNYLHWYCKKWQHAC